MAISTQSGFLQQFIAYVEKKLGTFNYASKEFDTTKSGSKLKYVLLSAHDDTIGSFLTTLGYLDRTCLFSLVNTQEGQKCNPSSPVASNMILDVSFLPQGNSNPQEDFVITTTYNGSPLQSPDINYNPAMTFKEFKNVVKTKLLITSVSKPRKFTSLEDYCGIYGKVDPGIKAQSITLLILVIISGLLIASNSFFSG